MNSTVEQGLGKFGKELYAKFKEMYTKVVGIAPKPDPVAQILGAVEAVFKSWNCDRAKIYRSMNNISDDLGTGVTVQMMVFGNLSHTSGTGVVFTRNPNTGEKVLYGEYLENAQGEDVVAGIRTPQGISLLNKLNPEIYAELIETCDKLEKHWREMQDIEFTIENGKLYILQTRKGQRTAVAALKIAVDLVNEKILTKEQALLSIDATSLSSLFHPTFQKSELEKAKELASGLAASPGAACGKIVFSKEAAKKYGKEKVILVRTETCADDIEGMISATGILTAKGGMTSHAAVVARGIGRTCVVGCFDLTIDEANKTCTICGKTFKEGDIISIDGTTGSIYDMAMQTQVSSLPQEFNTIMAWADKVRKLKVRANAETPEDAEVALNLGAQGIGLVRTEHMFFRPERLSCMREMIAAQSTREREKALAKLLPMQKEDFVKIFNVMRGLPVTIRLLDPPLHEFAPDMEHLKESNPMLGHRGVRLLITYPEIAIMQTRAIIEAAVQTGAHPEIMIPLVVGARELRHVSAIVKDTANQIIKDSKAKIKFTIGTMIETPRACLVADYIAKEAKFFSFGTNDLTQMTYGFSRDDSSVFLPHYVESRLISHDPFVRLDKLGVGQLIKIAVQKGREVNPNLKVGICGEHGGDVSSIYFCHEQGLDYVSCSAFRLPTARLAAAQAALLSKT